MFAQIYKKIYIMNVKINKILKYAYCICEMIYFFLKIKFRIF